ncbi:apoptotic protease-activating factor 1-like isoform X1 [Dermacentor variabilis]|uniref:apoptotic protease-activating factor 1-like isoform X1 n=2 Tax=Dermacentor variabilis TaxID=34621 RepID=UPI003F5C6C50
MTTGLELGSIMHELDTAEKICLTKLRDAIVADVEVKFVLPYIEAADIFSKEEHEDILKQDSVENKVRRLLDVLCCKGEAGYNVFIKALEHDNAYGWIAQKLRMEHNNIKKENVHVHKVLQNGGVPFRLVHLVKRRRAVQEIRDALRSLCSSGYRCNGAVVLHGMIGCGKSILAAEALRDYSLLVDCFPDGVYWLPIGKLREQSDVLLKMHLQLDRLNLGSHKDVSTIEMATCRLKRWSLNDVKALLVLDDVWSARVVEAFTVGCPLLVTTRDDSVVNDMHMYKQSLQIDEGLTLNETRELFASVLKIPEQELPPEVEEIWKAHRGLPLLMANIAAVLIPNAKRPDKWRPYIEDARVKGRVRHGSGSTYDAPLELIISSLDSEQLGYLQSFALFLEDVDIPSSVFEVLWDMNAGDVEHAMAGLVQKSLVRMEPVHNSYTYGIHDLYLNFLKRKATSLKDLHRQFVEKLLERWEPWTMPCSRGYFYWYLGYHLDEAGMDQKFRDIFLNLRFVERKVQCNCHSDLVTDLHRYEHHFRCDPQVAKERLDMLRFLQPNAHLLSDRDTDVIQLALSQPRSSTVHQKALALARERAAEADHQTPYFEWMNMPDNWSQAEVRMKTLNSGVNHAEFSPDDTIIASAGNDSIVRLWETHSGNELQALAGHRKAVNYCTFSPDGRVLASASSDHQVFLWNVCESFQATPASPLSASSKAGRLNGRRSSRCTKSASVTHDAAVLCCTFSLDGKLLASGDAHGFVKIHRIFKGELGEEIMQAIPQQEKAIRSCSFTSDSRRLVLALNSQYVVIWKVPSDTRTAQTEPLEKPQVLDHLDNAVVDCCLTHVHRGALGVRQQAISAAGQHIWTWDLRNPSAESVKRYNGFWMSYNLTCCAVSPDKTLIAAGTSLHAILLWNADTGATLGSFKGDAEDVKSVRFSHNGSQLVSSSSDGTVVIWDVDNYRRCSRVALMPILAVAFEDQSPLVATFDESGVIQISSGLKTKQEVEHAFVGTENRCEEVSCCCFTHDRKGVVLGTKNGCVSLFHLDTTKCSALGNHNDSVTSLQAWPEGVAISASLDTTVKIWHGDGSHSTLIGHRGQITAPCRLFGGGFKLLSSSDKGELMVWNLKQCSHPSVQIEAHNRNPVLCCDVSSDGQWLLSGSTDKTIQLWNAETGELLKVQTLNECVRCCRFGPDTQSVTIAAGTDEGSVYVYLLEEDLLQKIGQHKLWVYDLAFSPDGQQLASLSESICWWSLDSLEFASALSSLEDGSIASFESLAQPSCHRQLQRFQLQSSKAVALFASPDFNTFVTVDDSGILYVLNKLAAAQARES